MILERALDAGRGWLGLVPLAWLVLLAVTPSAKASGQTEAEICRIFLLLKEDNGRLVVKQEPMPQGQVRVFQSNPETGIIDVVLPPGLGGSGSLEDISKGRLLVVSCRDGKLQVTTKLPDGKEYARPAQPIDVLSTYDIRLTVLGAQGLQLKGLISAYRSFAPDEIVPLMDPFGGTVKPGPNEYIVYTETTTRRVFSADLHGQTPVEFFGGHHYVRAKLPDGSIGQLVVDLGSSTTVVSRALLPQGANIGKMERTMYTPDGVKRLAAVLGGATGEVANILGSATVPLIDLGDLRLNAVEAVVLKDLPEISGRRIVGILGMDILGQAKRLSLEYPHPGRENTWLRVNPAPSEGGVALRVPFSFAEHIFVQGKINGSPVSFILDSGSPTCILDETAAKSIGLPIGEARGQATGLGVDRVALKTTTVPSLQLAGRTFNEIVFDVAPLQVFNTYRGNQNIGLLGNTFLSRFARMDVDFESHELRLYEQ
jgi:hypothetical protein